MTSRRSVIAMTGAILAAPRLACAAWEPSRPVQLIVGFPPGGGADLAARAAGEAAQRFFPTPLVVINRPGAGGAIAAQQMTTLPPDGLSPPWRSPLPSKGLGRQPSVMASPSATATANRAT